MKNKILIKYSLLVISFLVIHISIYGQNKNIKFNFKLPYSYSNLRYFDSSNNKEYSIIDIPEKNDSQIIIDSVEIKFDNSTNTFIYFITSYNSNIDLQCPIDFGILGFDSTQNIIYKNFSSYSYNMYLGIRNLIINGKNRKLLVLGKSGCGSGGTISFFDMQINDGLLYVNKSLKDEEMGWSFLYFYPKKNTYAYINKYNPKSHYSTDSRYEISYYNLTSNQFIKKYITKYHYPDFTEIGEKGLLNKIKIKEPKIITN